MSESTEELKSMLTSLIMRFDDSKTAGDKHIEAQVAFNGKVYADLTHLRHQIDAKNWIPRLQDRVATGQPRCVHNVFHVSQLKPYSPNYTMVFAELSRPPDLAIVEQAPKEMLDRRMVKHGDAVLVQLHVRWSSSPAAITWEDYDTLRQRYPTATIWQGAAGHQVTLLKGREM